jgi:hypothetical protein
MNRSSGIFFEKKDGNLEKKTYICIVYGECVPKQR